LRGDLAEAVRSLAPIQEVLVRDELVGPDRDDAIRLGEGERPNQHAADDRKDRGICARSEREQRDGHRRKPGPAEDVAEGEGQVWEAHGR
jgi:hypothetical protein